jgi:hypothetical protein
MHKFWVDPQNQKKKRQKREKEEENIFGELYSMLHQTIHQFFINFLGIFLFYGVYSTYLSQWINNTNSRACVKHFVEVSFSID